MSNTPVTDTFVLREAARIRDFHEHDVDVLWLTQQVLANLNPDAEWSDDFVNHVASLCGREKYAVCETCGGEGYTSRLGAFTQDWLDEQFGGPGPEMDEFIEDYTRRGGPYDEACRCCKGQRVVTAAQELRYLDLETWNAEVEAERRMGA